jgi:hypothetical protein
LTLVRQINATNSATDFGDGMTIADAIAMRDSLGARYRAYQTMYDAGTISVSRYNQNEIKFVRYTNLKEIQGQLDKLAKEYREMDTKLQGVNWAVDLV